MAYLYDAATEQGHPTFKKIEGDWQTLEGYGVLGLRELVILDENRS